MKRAIKSTIVNHTTNKQTKNRLSWSVKICMMLLAACTFVACNDDDDNTEEYPQWKETNANYFEQLYNSTKQKISSGDNSWKIIKSYAKDPKTQGAATDYIIVHITNQGTGTECPLTSDTVRVDYQGRLLPSTSYPNGKIFDQSWAGDYNLQTNSPSKFAVNAVVDGFSTALQKMHVGDRWTVYIPHELGYKAAASANIPAYSTLIFDITLRAIYKPGKPVPNWK